MSLFKHNEQKKIFKEFPLSKDFIINSFSLLEKTYKKRK